MGQLPHLCPAPPGGRPGASSAIFWAMAGTWSSCGKCLPGTTCRRGSPAAARAFSPEAVALACYVSVRQLHRVFAREGLTFGGWVCEQRLRRCRDDLADPRLSHLTAGQIAARWGFRSAAHLTRAFRARYGATPASRRGPGPRQVRSG
jgi:AraC-like DNA-binding protein